MSERKEDDPVVGNTTTTTNSNNKRSSGLSELSNQLQISRAQNEAIKVEINRLERQLKILADLQGIKVDDLRKALEDACANEAFEEMQNRVAKLRSELEAATLIKQAELRKDAAAPYIATLEARIKELEDSEISKLRKENKDLCDKLEVESMRADELEMENERLNAVTLSSEMQEVEEVEEKHKKEIQQLQDQLEKKDEDIRDRDLALSQMTVELERLLSSLKEKDDIINETNADYEKAMLAMVEKDQTIFMAQEELKLEKKKSSRKLQDDEDTNDARVREMGQQLESLYAAFGVIDEEHDSERRQRRSLESNLTSADYALAQQLENPNGTYDTDRVLAQQLTSNDRNNNSNNTGVAELNNLNDWGTPTPRTLNGGIGGIGGIGGTDQVTSPEDMLAIQRALEEEDMMAQIAAQTAVTDSYMAAMAGRTRSPPEAIGERLILSGVIMIRSKGVVKKWKTKYCRLYQVGSSSNSVFSLGEGKEFSLVSGISTVDFNPNHPLSFILSIDSSSSRAPVIYAATSTEDDYHRWMDALHRVTSS